MQATLQQASPPQPDSVVPSQPVVKPLWTAQPWFMAAAATSTILLVTFCVWQRNQINDLRQTVMQLNKQQTVASSSAKNAARPDQLAPATSATSSSGRGEQTAAPDNIAQSGSAGLNTAQPNPLQPDASRTPVSERQPDTVYVTRYVPVPTPSNVAKVERPNQRVNRSTRRSEAIDQPTYSGSDAQQRAANPTNAPAEQVASAPVSVRQPTNRVTNAPDNQNQLATIDRPTNEIRTGQSSGQKDRQRSSDQRETFAQPENDLPQVSTRQPANSGTSEGKAAVSEANNQPTMNYELMTNRPVQVASTDWSAALLRRANRAKPVRTITVGGQAPASQPVEHVATRLRLGGSSDMNKNIWSLGVSTEVLIGKHWALNVGLSRAIRRDGPFNDEEDFYVRTHRNFKKEYGRLLDPKPNVFNIETRTVRVQLPVSLGYRIPVSQRFTLLPSVGTNLNLGSNEYIKFYHLSPFYGPKISVVEGKIPRRVDLFNNLTFNASVEWQQRHWALQAGPVVTAPTQADMKWQTGLNAGLRARVLYQF